MVSGVAGRHGPAPKLAVIMPAYNEEQNIGDAIAEVRDEVLDQVEDAELIVVNDGSKDRTGAILDELAEHDSRIRVIHQRNSGHGGALRAGLDAADAEFLFLIDSDRQIPVREFRALWAAAQQGDGAFGRRLQRHDPVLRVWLTTLVRWIVTLLFGVRLHDANVPFKIVRRTLWLEARPLIPPDALTPSLLLAIFASLQENSIVVGDVPHRERRAGTVSIRRLRLLRFCCRAFVELLRFRARVRRRSRCGS